MIILGAIPISRFNPNKAQGSRLKALVLPDLIFKATSKNVIPAKAGIQNPLTSLDSRRSLPRTRYGAGVTN